MKPLPKRAHGKEALLFRRGVSARLRGIALVLGSKSGMAELMGVSKSVLSNWISQDEPLLPSVEPLIRLCEATGCTLDYIFRGIQAGLTTDLANKIREAQAGIAQSEAANINRRSRADRKAPLLRRLAE